MSAAAIADQIIGQAIQTGGATWMKIQKAAPLYIRGYAQTLAEIAKGVAKGEISKADAKMYVRNAHLLLVMGIANTAQVVLVQVQTFIDGVLKTLKTSINATLPFPLL
jgi:hypothetical protein